MSYKELPFDSRALDQWATEGGYVPPDEEEAEQRRLSLSSLRDFLIPIVGDESNFALLVAVVDGAVSSASLADALGIHRSSAGRRVSSFLRRLRKKIASDPDFFNRLPSPWREAFGQ